jgi:hypothetical protein
MGGAKSTSSIMRIASLAEKMSPESGVSMAKSFFAGLVQ